MKKAVLILSLLFIAFNISNAQKDIRFSEISEKQKVKFKKQVKEKIENLGFSLKTLAQQNDPQVIENIIEGRLREFIDGAKIYTGTLKNGKLDTVGHDVKTYLKEIVPNYKNTEFSFVDIEFVSFDIGDLKPLRGQLNTYYFDYTFVQSFKKGTRKKSKNKELEYDIDYTYQDITTKSGRIIVKKVNTVLGSKWRLFFGDIEVNSVKEI